MPLPSADHQGRPIAVGDRLRAWIPRQPRWAWWATLMLAGLIGAWYILLYTVIPVPVMTTSFVVVFILGCWGAVHAPSTPSWAARFYVAFWAVWALTLPLSTRWNPTAKAVVREVESMAWVALVSVGVVLLVNGLRHRVDALRWWWLGIILTILPVTFWEMLTAEHLRFTSQDAWYEALGRQPTAALINPNNLACVLLAGVAVMVIWLRDLRSVRAQVGVVAVIACCLPVLWMTQSRAGVAIYMVLCGLGGVAWMRSRGQQLTDDGARRSSHPLLTGRWTWWVLSGIAAAALVASFIVPALRATNPLYQLIFGSDAIAQSDASRITWTRWGAKFFVESPWLGKGAGSFEPMFKRRSGTTMNMHNSYLEIVSQYGLVVGVWLIACLVAGLLLLRRVWLARRLLGHAARSRAWTAVLLAIPYGVTGMLVSSALGMHMWWLMLAHLVAVSWVLRRDLHEAEANQAHHYEV